MPSAIVPLSAETDGDLKRWLAGFPSLVVPDAVLLVPMYLLLAAAAFAVSAGIGRP
ncbi:hypothetical protein [Dactylosporangium sp. NPDC000521]|uniref:hypothetical protein n=1 Tax=Dactylosporangium sp. NPDC000521 TaxID=3363975 RepID=UPI0036BCB277